MVGLHWRSNQVDLSSFAPVTQTDGLHRKGALQPITLSVKTRQGRKTVTHVAGLETFGVDVDEFAEELRKLCAGSASGQLNVPIL